MDKTGKTEKGDAKVSLFHGISKIHSFETTDKAAKTSEKKTGGAKVR